jgi:adenine phosphoribosyltransferase
MTRTYTVTIGQLTRDLPIIQLPSNIKIALFNSLSDTEIIVEAAQELSARMPATVEVLLTPEAKSIPLTYELAKQTKLPYVVARKTAKPYMGQTLSAEVTSITTGKPQHLYLGEKDVPRLKDKLVGLVDDVVSTGATVKALSSLVQQADGTVDQILTVFTEGKKDQWSEVISLGHLPIFD